MRLFYFFIVLLAPVFLMGQQSGLISGPWAGNIEMRNATIWLSVRTSVKAVSVKYYPVSMPTKVKVVKNKTVLGNDFNPLKVELNGLDFGTTYKYEVIIDGKALKLPFETKFRTKDLWQYRKPAPDFSFLAGSCAYFNEPVYDRPGKPYGSDSSIFATMAKTPADFHIWLGDNWYTREVDYYSPWGLEYRASHDRAVPVLQSFMASMPQFAIWDDHDYGPNDAGSSYIFREESREIFKKYWLNPSYGQDGKGIYSKVTWSDVDFFLMDDRYFRSDDNLPDSAEGRANVNKTFYGAAQFQWLMNELLFSKAAFKIIVTGSQVLNPVNKYECMRNYTVEYNQLISFLTEHRIPGVMFFTGDRHHSEIIRIENPSFYNLYDITVSPYTSGVYKAGNDEASNPYRIPNTLIEAQNFAKVSVSGKRNERVLQVRFIGLKGEELGEWSISEKDLKPLSQKDNH